jgi:LCP family protein required for cell wall assembly
MDRRKAILTAILSITGVIILIMTIFWILSMANNIEEIDAMDQDGYVQEISSSKIQEEEMHNNNNNNISETEKNINNSVGKNEDEDVDVDEDTEDVRMFLFLGIDRTEERDSQYSIYRADSISILRIDLENSWAKVLSIPRDTYTYLPITDKKDKINHAYAFGTLKGRAEASMLEAVNLLLEEEEMRKYFTLEMEPIAAIVNQIGGVWVDVEIDMNTHGAQLSKGYQKLNGEEAFDYIHWRYSGDGDIGRIRRQQQFAIALLKKLSEEYKGTDLTKFFLSNSEYSNTNIHVSELAEVTEALSVIEDIEFATLQGSSIKIDGIYYWKLDETKLNETLTWFYEKK